MLANVGLPSFLPHSLATLLGLVVIAAIEAWFLARLLDLPYREAYGHSAVANWKSTIVGIPCAWLLWFFGMMPFTSGVTDMGVDLHPLVRTTLFQSVFFGATIPDEWFEIGLASAWIVMLVPFWFGSVWIERQTIEKRIPDSDSRRIRTAVIRGNLCTYSVFLIFGVIGLVVAIQHFPEKKIRYEKFRKQQEIRKLERAAEREIEKVERKSRME